MKIECPNCKKTGEVDDSKIPKEGIGVRCPKCGNRFIIMRENSKEEFIVEPLPNPSKLIPKLPPKIHSVIQAIKTKILSQPLLSKVVYKSSCLLKKMGRRGKIGSIVFLTLILLSFLFRYEKEYVFGRSYRYDRFTSTVEVRRSDDKWVALPWFKNLQHVRDAILQDEADDRRQEAEDANNRMLEELENQQREADYRKEEMMEELEKQKRAIEEQKHFNE